MGKNTEYSGFFPMDMRAVAANLQRPAPRAFTGSTTQMDLTGLANGTYILQLTDAQGGGQTIRKQVVKL
ncbi:MAG: T9SS type A sorting domain-containing protein [Cytophagaceae bacterium]|nr:MAG: T9SS type A sorting domain-containing protein [Cytophagaceae bacterium]